MRVRLVVGCFFIQLVDIGQIPADQKVLAQYRNGPNNQPAVSTDQYQQVWVGPNSPQNPPIDLANQYQQVWVGPNVPQNQPIENDNSYQQVWVGPNPPQNQAFHLTSQQQQISADPSQPQNQPIDTADQQQQFSVDSDRSQSSSGSSSFGSDTTRSNQQISSDSENLANTNNTATDDDKARRKLQKLDPSAKNDLQADSESISYASDHQFDESMIDEKSCDLYTFACIKYRSCYPYCELPEDPRTREAYNPCRRFVEPCFGIQESNYVKIKKFKDIESF